MGFAIKNARFFFVLIAIGATFGVLASGMGGTATSFQAVPSRGEGAGAPEWAVPPSGPGGLRLPEMIVRLEPVPATGARVWVENGLSGEWLGVHLADGTGTLPVNVATVSDLWALRFRVEGADASSLTLVPSRPLVLTDLETGQGVAPALTLTNWGEAQALRVKAVDLAGRAVELQSADVNLACSFQGAWYDLGVLPTGFERDVIVAAGQKVRYPVSVTVENEAKGAAYAVLTGAPEAAPVGQVNYYGLTPAKQWDCDTGLQVTGATSMVITAISAPVTYTLYNLTDGQQFATGTISAKGAQATVSSMTDAKAWKLATSKPVQAYMGYDCSGTLPGSMFFLADDGMLNYGTSFTVPFANWETSGTPRLQYWVFATGAGTATVKDLAGNPVSEASYHFGAAGAWQILLTNFTRNTVYTISFVPDVAGSGAVIAVQQSSQNAATDVPATTQAANACTVTNVGRTFYVDIQQYSGDARIAAFAYEGTGSGVVRATNLATGASTDITTHARLGRAYRSDSLPSGAYRVDCTVAVGIIAGSPEGGTSIYDLGDDAFYYHGDGTDIRGAAMRCGGKLFVAQDGTNITAGCTPSTPCGLPTGISNPYNADSVLTISGDSSNTNLFDFHTQDTLHTLLVEVIGGNCTDQLNDWSKVLQPAAVGRPVIVYPASDSPLLSTTPTLVGTAIPTATVQVYIAPPPPGTPGTQVLLGEATADANGNWSLPYPTGSFAALTPGTTYNFDAVQFLAGACSAVPVPPIGSSGSSGVINVTAPAITAPGDGSTIYTGTPTLLGTAPAGTTVTLTITGPGGPYMVTTTADGAGQFRAPSPALPLGSFSVSAVATDGAGNISPTSLSSSFTVATLSAPVVNDNLAAGATAVTGTSAAPEGSAITVSVGGTLYAGSVGAGGNWSVTVPALVAGTSVNATVTADGVTSPVSNTVVVHHPSPVVESTIAAGATSVSGTSASPDGTVITIYKDGVSMGTAGVAGGQWTLTGVTGLVGGEAITAVAAAGTPEASAPSGPVIVTPAAPIITSPILEGATSVSGTSAAPAGSTITVTLGGNTYTNTVQADGGWSVTVPALADGDTLTATVTVGTATSAPSAPVVVSANATDVTPAPVVTSPILADATSVAGTSTSPTGTIIDVFVDGVFVGQTTVQAGGTWSLGSIGPLTDGQKITATATDLASNHGTSAPSAPVYVSADAGDQTPAPTVSSPIYDGAAMVYGTSTSSAGAIIDVYVGGLFVGQATVQAGGTWTLSGIGPLATLQVITATAMDLANHHGTSSPSAPVIVEPSGAGDVTPVPSVTSPLIAGTTAVSGTSSSPKGTQIDVFVYDTTLGNTWAGQTTVQSDGTWTLTVGSALAAGQSVTAKATAVGLAQSGPSAAVYVAGVAGATPAPVVGSPINATATSIPGTSTSPDGTRIDVYGLLPGGTQPTYLGSTTVTSNGWTLIGLSPLVAGTVITATATETGKGTSALSSAVTVSVLVNLLRYGGVTSLSPLTPAASTIFVAQYPADPALDPARDTIVSGFLSGTPFPGDAYDLADTPPLVFYQLQGNTGDTLRVTKSGGKIVITYTN